MRPPTKIILSCILALSATSTAFAADNGLFPTDILKQGKIALTGSYGFSSYKAGTTDPLITKIKTEGSIASASIQAGLGYGLDAQIAADYSLNLRSELTESGSTLTNVSKGFSNPMIAIRWNPLETFDHPEKFGLALGYAYKTAKLGDNRSIDYGYEMHRITGTVSYNLGISRMYVGYKGEFRGKFDGLTVGDTHSATAGVKFIMNDDLDINFDNVVGFQTKSDAFGSYMTAATSIGAEYQLLKNLWVVPYVGCMWTDDRPITGATSYVKSSAGYAAGSSIRFVF